MKCMERVANKKQRRVLFSADKKLKTSKRKHQ